MRGPMAGKRLLAVFPSALEAEDFLGDLSFFWPGGDASLLPALDRNPFIQRFSGVTGMGERIIAASKLCSQGEAVVATAIPAILRRLPAGGGSAGRKLLLRPGEELDFAGLGDTLSAFGYRRVPQVESHGEYSVRGGIVDVFPVGCLRPARLEFFGDFLESLREFAVEDQRSVKGLDSLGVSPLSAVPVDEAGAKAAAAALAKMANAKGWDPLLWEPIASHLLSGGEFHDFENWSPLLKDNLRGMGGFLEDSDAAVLLYEPARLMAAGDDAYLALSNHFQALEREERPHLPLGALYEEPKGVLAGLRSAKGGVLSAHGLALTGAGDGTGGVLFPTESTGDLRLGIRAPGMATGFLLPLVGRVRALLGRGFKVTLVLRNRESVRRLAELLQDHDMSPRASRGAPAPPRGRGGGSGELVYGVGQLSEGFVAPYDLAAYVSEEEIFGNKRRVRKRASEEIRSLSGGLSLHDLSPGDYVVHAGYGIGQYRGLVTKTMSTGYQGEFLSIAYRHDDMLFVPVETFGMVSKYVGATDRPPSLDRLGSSANWERLKEKVAEDIRRQAEELLELYARRQVTPGFAYSPDDADFLNFEAAFPYEETPDQEKAIREVLSDLSKTNPMDRLVCGDVGFGKTEVAIRAAYKVVSDGKQVAVLVPTTILAEQHERTFRERFSEWPVTVDSISRLKKPQEQRKVLDRLATGGLDIVIGTHRLLQRDVAFKDLGLLVIDEEHRFGVAHKERLKKARASVDVLSMSATPIPRSLSMSMRGIRDMSLIQSPPVDRLSVRTSLIKRDDLDIAAAIDRELARGGQVYFIHNRISDIHLWVARLTALLPLARFGVGHGRLKPRELEAMVRGFWKKEIDVWVSTTIVESGLDFPDANTIIIDQADRFGLAQLYQLRGRVGRGSEQAYCHLMVDDPDTLTMDARKRLQAIMENGDLGSGYQVAVHDLQIRGSGNVLGMAQHGAASLVGFELYNQLVEQAVGQLKEEPVQDAYEPEIVLGVPAFLPGDYAPDTNARIILYRRLSRAASLKDIRAMEEELVDRFGPPPPEAVNLLGLSAIKVLAKAARATRVVSSPEGLTIGFWADNRNDRDEVLDKALALAKDPTKRITLNPKGELFVPRKSINRDLGEIAAAKSVLGYLLRP
jgi:transcription-repair coupling factor (superfamily II helicase)